MALADRRLDLVRSPFGGLARLTRFDQRLATNIEALRLYGDMALAVSEAALEMPSAGSVFTLAVRALEKREHGRLEALIGLAQAVPDTAAGLRMALGWVDPSRLQGTVVTLLAGDPFSRTLGTAACAMHRVDPGHTTARLLQDDSPLVRARAYRGAGELGLGDLRHRCAAASRSDKEPDVRFWAAWSAVLLGERGGALDSLTTHASQPKRHRQRAFQLALLAMSASSAHAQLQRLTTAGDNLRWVIQGSGLAGDPAYVPWLIKQMGDLTMARIAGEAFSLICGVDLGAAALATPAPEGIETGPNDDPDDPNVDMDPDEGLPWPDADRISLWWAANGQRFQPGGRYFMGGPVTPGHCLTVLRSGNQRQRTQAAQHLCLMDPGVALFNTSAPAWRQQQLLARLS